MIDAAIIHVLGALRLVDDDVAAELELERQEQDEELEEAPCASS